MPAFMSGDAGSQVKGATRRVTWSSQVEVQNDDTDQSGDWSLMLDTVKQKFKGTSWFIAPASSHYYNGQVEGNLCVLKGLLTGHLKIMNMKNYVFKSMILMSQTFSKVNCIMNTRPLLYSEDEVLTCQDLLFPRNSQNNWMKAMKYSSICGNSQLWRESSRGLDQRCRKIREN